VGIFNSFGEELATALDSLELDAVLGCYTGSDERSPSLFLHSSFLHEELSDFIKLMFLNRSIPEVSLTHFISKKTQRTLIEAGFLSVHHDEVSLKNLRLVYHHGAYILCHTKTANGFAYYGADSLALGRIVQRCRGRILDVCGGVGTQGIFLALAGAEIKCIDTNPLCEELFWLNAIINRVIDRVSFECCNIANVEGLFDWIICNPPLLPVPECVEFLPVGDGGPDGLHVLKQVFQGSNRLLAEKGRVRFICTVLGNKNFPDLTELERMAKECCLSLDLLVPCCNLLSPGEPMFEGLVGTAVLAGCGVITARRAFSKHFSGFDRTHLYSILGTACRSQECTAGPGIRTVSRHYEINRSFWSL
jgi:hypothetical protein